MRRLTVALACVALASAPACGGGEEDTGETPRPPVPTIPEADPPADTEAETLTEEPDSPVEPEPAPSQPEPEPDPGGAVAPTEPEPPVDSPENDLPPPPGSEAEDFEEFCDANPGACG